MQQFDLEADDNVFMLAQRAHKHLKASAVCTPILATSLLTGEMYFLLDQLFQRLLFMWWIAEENQLFKRQSLTSLFDQEEKGPFNHHLI